MREIIRKNVDRNREQWYNGYKGSENIMFISEKAAEIINNQKPMDKNIVERVKHILYNKGIILEQSIELDKWLISKGVEALTFSNGDIIMHTKVSASGFYEEGG